MGKKVPVYPFPCQMVGKEGTLAGQVLKVSQRSVLANTGRLPLLVNSVYQVKFVVPLVNAVVDCEAVVFKTYDKFKGKHGEVQPGDHVVEMVFRNIPDGPRKLIAKFIGYLQVSEL